jgi:hypothetical protein
MNYGRIPFHDEQRLPPEQRSKGPPSKPTTPPETGTAAFFLERDRAFNATMNEDAIVAFLVKHQIPYPKTSPIQFWTMVYTGVLVGHIGGSGSRERATIWLHVHKWQGLIDWSVKTGTYSFNNKRYRLNHKLMLRRPNFNDNAHKTQE